MPPGRARSLLLVLLLAAAGCGDAAAPPAGGLGGVRFTTIGRLAATFVDAQRPTQANGAFPGAATRTLTSLVWYPALADGSGDGGSEIPCLDGIARAHRGAGDRCSVHDDAPLDAHGAPYPLIVFSHGFANGASATSSFAEALAGYGYVVVAPDFPLSKRDAPGGATVADLPAQAGDVSFLIDVFTGAVAGVPEAFAGAIDAARIGAAGRSLGGSTTLFASHRSGFRDPRIGAAAAVSPGWFVQTALFGSDGYFAGITTPLLIVGGSDDTTAPFATNDQPPYDLARPPKILVELLGEGHTPETPEANAALVAFFDAYLANRTSALAVIDGLPGAVVQKQL